VFTNQQHLMRRSPQAVRVSSVLILCAKLCKPFQLEYLNICTIRVTRSIVLLETYLSDVHQFIKKFGSES